MALVAMSMDGLLPWLTGLLVFAIFYVVGFGFVFYLVDSIFRLGMMILMLPIFIMAYAFGPTKKWTGIGFSNIMYSAAFMMAFSIIIATVLLAMISLIADPETGGIFNPSECQAQLEAGGVDCLASFSAEPLENIQGFEEVPTCSELGYDIDFRMFRGLAGAPGMSDAALTYWQEVCRQVSEDPAWTEDYLLARGLTPAFIIGDDLTAFMEDQYETYYNAQKELGLI